MDKSPVFIWKRELRMIGERDVRRLLDVRVRFDDGSRKTHIYGIDWTGVVCGLLLGPNAAVAHELYRGLGTILGPIVSHRLC